MKEKANYGNSENYTASVTPVAQKQESLTSEGQKALWFLCQTQKFEYSYCEQVSVEVDRPLDIHRFTQCINVLIERHESLRTVFKETEDGELLEVVHEPYLIEIPVVLIQDEKPDSQTLEEKISIESQKQGQIQYNLDKEPPFRVSILQLPDNRQIVLLSFHHLIMDGRSIDIILNEWKALDSAFFNNTMPKLAKLPLQFSNFTTWESEFLNSETSKTYKEYWGKKFATPPEFINLPYDQPWTPNTRKLSAREHIKIDTNTVGKLKNLEKETRCSVNTILLAAMQVLLMRYSGQTDICIGSQRANRKFNEFNAIIGYFTNVVAIRSDLSGEKTFKELLLAVKSSTKEADYKYQLPYSTVTNIARENGLPSDVPLCQVVLEFGGFSSKPTQFDSGPIITRIRNRGMGDSKFPLLFAFLIEEGELVGHIEYDVDLFNLDTIQRFYQHYLILLNAIIEDPNQNIYAIPLLNKAEYQKILFDWNQTDAPYPQDKTLHQLFEEQVVKTPDNIALVFEDEELTYQALNQRANQLAYLIRERYQQRNQSPIPPDTLIGLYLDRSLEMVVSILATLKAGGAYVPISPEYPKERSLFILEDIQAPILLTQQCFMEALDEWLPELPDAPDLLTADDVDFMVELPAINLEPISKPTDLAYVIYTSGTTGKPKGVMIEHHSVINLITGQTRNFEFTKNECSLWLASYIFDASVEQLFLPILNGSTLYIPTLTDLRDSETIKQRIIQNDITHLHATPSYLSILGSFDKTTNLKRIISGGETCLPDLKEIFGKLLVNEYGPTESTVTSIQLMDSCNNLIHNLIGKPIFNTQVYVLLEGRNPSPIGIPGELYIGGAGLSRGYLNRQKLTQERFVNNPFATKADKEKGYNKLYKTGDIVRWLPDGNLEYLGRNDFQVKIRGFRIELGEIENALANLPDVKQVVVIDRERDDNKYLAAYLVTEADVTIDQEQLREYLSTKLPEYMVPSTFTVIDALPLTVNGKLDRRALPEPDFFNEDIYVEPRNKLEMELCDIWQSVLKKNKVGIYDNFFRKGGNSLLSMLLVSKIKKQIGASLKISDIFEKPTIDKLCKYIADIKANSIPHKSISTIARSDYMLASFEEEYYYNLELQGKKINAQYKHHLHGQLNKNALAFSIQEIVNRYESFRTTFFKKNGTIYRYILEYLNISINEIDLRNKKEPDKTISLENQSYSDYQAIDLTKGPVLLISLLQLTNNEYVLLITTSHAIIDGLSENIFRKELSTLYKSYHRNEPYPLTPITLQYADYAYWQKIIFCEKELSQLEYYWINKISNFPKRLKLPMASPKLGTYINKMFTFEFTISKNLRKILIDIIKKMGTTTYVVFLTFFSILLASYSNQYDIMFVSPMANRNSLELNNLIGCFLTLTCQNIYIDSKLGFLDLLSFVNEIYIDDIKHEIPISWYGKLAENEVDRINTQFCQFSINSIDSHPEELDFPDITSNSTILYHSVNNKEKILLPDLALLITELNENMCNSFSLAYNPNLYDESAARKITTDFCKLMNLLTECPRCPIKKLKIF